MLSTISLSFLQFLMLFFMFPVFSITLNFLQSHVLYHQYNHEYHAPRQNLEMQLQMTQLSQDKIQYSKSLILQYYFTSRHTNFNYISPSHPCHCWFLCHQIESRDSPTNAATHSTLSISASDCKVRYLILLFFLQQTIHTLKFMSLPPVPSLVQFGDDPI